MNLRTLFGVLFVVMLSATAHAGPLCALASGSYRPQTDQTPTILANQQMANANAVLCESGRFFCPPFSFWQNPTAGNAQAFLGPSGGEIRYNPDFMNDVFNKFGAQATIGILAHELGHLIDFSNNSNPNISRYQREANADEYAGCAFALAGAPSSALSGLKRTLFSMGSSPGYPNTHQRAALIERGYQKCAP